MRTENGEKRAKEIRAAYNRENMRTLGANVRKEKAEQFRQIAERNGLTAGGMLRDYIDMVCATGDVRFLRRQTDREHPPADEADAAELQPAVSRDVVPQPEAPQSRRAAQRHPPHVFQTCGRAPRRSGVTIPPVPQTNALCGGRLFYAANCAILLL